MIGGNKSALTSLATGKPPAWADASEIWSSEIIRAYVALHGDDLDRRLLTFAENRGLVVSGSHWREDVLIAAGLEHPELATPDTGPKTKKRGRPPKTINRLMATGQPNDAEAVAMVDMLATANAARKGKGLKPVSDAKFARAWIAEREKHTKEETFKAAVRVLCNRISAARTGRGAPGKTS